jgi:hypothetical protein
MCSLQHTRREAGVRRGEVLLGGPSICDGHAPFSHPHLRRDLSSLICAGTRRRYFVSPTNPDAEIAKKNEEDFITIDGIRHSRILCATAATIVGAW